MGQTRIVLRAHNQVQLDEQINELVSGLIATDMGLSQFVLAVEKASAALNSKDYPLPPCLGDDRRGAAIYEGFRLGAEWLLKLILDPGPDGLGFIVMMEDES